MIKHICAFVVANVFAFGLDGMLRVIFNLRMSNQYWFCLNIAWLCVAVFVYERHKWSN